MDHPFVPPEFESMDSFKAHVTDVLFWLPYIDITLAENGLTIPEIPPVAGHNATYPTFVYDEVVIKFFGHLDAWRRSYRFERSALELVATERDMLAPELLCAGYLADDPDSGWAYLITRRVPGQAVWRLDRDSSLQERLAIQLGQQLRRIHPLRSPEVATHADWNQVDVTAGARASSLPEHLVEQVADYVAGLGPPEPAFVNADIVANHIYVDNGHLSGIIDWGDALITDRHVELIQIYRDLFNCDKHLFRILLETSEWPVSGDFPKKVLGYALHRQALMKAQHQGGGDVFEPIAAQFPLEKIATLDELAEVLFDTGTLHARGPIQEEIVRR